MASRPASSVPRFLPLSGAPGDEGVMEAFDQEQPGSAWMLRSPGYGVGWEGAYSSFPQSGGDRGGSFNIEVGESTGLAFTGS